MALEPGDPSKISIPAGSPSEGERFHALDAVRAFALLLGVVFHAAESFDPSAKYYWAIADSSPSSVLVLCRHACHSFRLEIFFLIAGFFAHLLYHRRGPAAFIRNRLSRILVPLVVGWAVLFPILVYLWLLGASLTGRLGMFGVPPELQHTPPALLALGSFLTLQFTKQFDLTHLWFLHQLLILYAGFLALRWVGCGLIDRQGSLRQRMDQATAWLFGSGFDLLVLGLATVPMLRLMRSWDVDTPKNSLWPYPPTTLLFGFQFGVGWFLHRQPGLFEAVARRWPSRLGVGVLMMVPTTIGIRWLRGMGVDPGSAGWVRWVYTICYALMMWGFVLGVMGLFVRVRRVASPAWRYLADSSYWVYLVHLPVVVGLQIWVGRWPVPWLLKYPLILSVAIPLLYLSYHYLVRSTFIGVQLNGRKYPRTPLRKTLQSVGRGRAKVEISPRSPPGGANR